MPYMVMVMSTETEMRKAQDAIKSSLNFMQSISVYQRRSLITIMRMSYYLGMLTYAKEHERLRQLLLQGDDDE